MPRRLDSVNQGGFVEAIDVDESELEAVVGMLGFSDAQKSETARDQIYRALEFFQTARSHSIKAKTIREDRGDLNKLAEAINPETMTARLEDAIAALESLQTENPVLFQRLRSLLSGQELHDVISFLQEAEKTIFLIGRDLASTISTLDDEIGSEDGRGRPPDRAACAFANRLYDIWVEHTGGRTSRQNAPERQKQTAGLLCGRLRRFGIQARGIVRCDETPPRC